MTPLDLHLFATPEVCKAFAADLFVTAKLHEESWNGSTYNISLREAADKLQRDEVYRDVVWSCLQREWNESLDFAEAYGFKPDGQWATQLDVRAL